MTGNNGAERTYITLSDDLRRDILTNRLSGNQPVKSENALAKDYQISRSTVRKALNMLVAEGLLKKVRGSGTFVIPSEERRKKNANTNPQSVQQRQVLFLSLATALSEAESQTTFGPMLTGFMRVLEPAGYNVLFSHVGINWTPPPSLVNGDVGGIIFHGPIHHNFFHRYVEPLPHVGIQYVDHELTCNWVRIDNENLSFQAVEHLFRLGHRRIGFVSDEIESQHSAERFHGFELAMKHFGLEVVPEFLAAWQRPAKNGILLPEKSIPDYTPHLRSMFTKDAPSPTALVCVDDWRAICTWQALRGLGYDVPGDISLTGSFNERCEMPITGFSCMLSTVCSEASELLLDLMTHPEKKFARTVNVRPIFFSGKSTEKPDSGATNTEDPSRFASEFLGKKSALNFISPIQS